LEHGLVVVHAGRESQRAVAARHGLEQPRADRRRTTVLRDEYHGLRAQVQRQRRAWSRLATRRDDVSAPVARRDALARDVEAGERNLLVTLDREDLGECGEIEVVEIIAVCRRDVLDSVPGFR